MVNVFYDSLSILTKVYSDGAFLKQAIEKTPIEYVNRSLITKIVYGVLDKDIRLEYYLCVLCEKKPKRVIRTVLKIAMYSIEFLNLANHAVVNSAVELVKKLGKGANAGFVNAFLRNFSSKLKENAIVFPKDYFEHASVKYSYPVFAVKKLVADYGKKRAEKIMGADEVRTTVRFNSDVDGERYLEKRFDYEKTPFNNAFFVKNFKRNEDYDDGIYTFQSVGSIAICAVVSEGKRLFDACAAPGGKSVNLADKFDEVISSDIHPHRVALIDEYAKRMKKNNVKAVVCDSSVFTEEYAEKFDAVLCDAPCSGFGVVKDNPDIKLNREENDLAILNDTQYKILSCCSEYVKTGGFLYYSTCSVFKDENDKIVDKFLKNNDNYEICDIASPLKNVKTEYGLSFFPDISYGAGFYVAKMKRKL